MKNFVVCIIILVLGVLGPQQDPKFEPVWALGLLMLLAFLCQQLALHLRLPALVGWIGAGLILGPSCLQTLQPAQFASLRLAHTLAAVWVGFFVGTEFFWPRAQKAWRVPGAIALTTLAIFLFIAVATGSIAHLPGWLAVLIAALATLWGPFAVWSLQRARGHVLSVGIVGNGFSLIILSAVLVFLYLQRFLPPQALHLTGRLWLSLLTGGLGAEILWRLKVFTTPVHTLLPVLFSSFAIAALLLTQLQLYALPCGLAAGLVLVWRKGRTLETQRVLQFMRPMAFAIFFALVGATIDLRILWPVLDGFYQILVIQLLVLLFLRGLVPTFWPQFPTIQPAPPKHIGWLLLPKGALLFELVYHPRNGLVELLSGRPARLLHQVLLADILVHLLVFAILAAIAWHLSQSSSPPDTGEQEEPATRPALTTT